MENASKSVHPLFLVAAGSVTIASLAAAAHFAGLIPSQNRSAEPPPAVVASAPAVTPAPAPTAPPVVSASPATQPSEPAIPAKPAAQAKAAKPEVQHSAPRKQAQKHSPEPAPTQVARASDDDWRYGGGTRRVSTNDAGIDVIPARPAATPADTNPPICKDCGTVESVREVAAPGNGTGLGAIAGGVLGGVLGNQIGRGTGKDVATIAGAVGGAFAGHQVEKNVRSSRQYEVSVRFDDGSVKTYTLSNTAWHASDRVRLSNGNLAPL